jgi:hypothetical protein
VARYQPGVQGIQDSGQPPAWSDRKLR